MLAAVKLALVFSSANCSELDSQCTNIAILVNRVNFPCKTAAGKWPHNRMLTC